MKTPNRLCDWEESLLVQLRHYSPHSQEQKWLIRCLDQVESTMNEARELASEVKPETPGIVVARAQIKGRGRSGRVWKQAPEALYTTLVFASKRPPSQLGGASLLVGVVVQSVLSALGCEVGVKWPNDILALDGRKLGGVLVEQFQQNGLTYLLCGIGINLSCPPSGFEKAVSVADLSSMRPSPLEMAARLAPSLFSEFCLFREQGFFIFKDRFLASAIFLGATVSLEVGEEIVTGIYVGVSDSGALMLKVGEETRELASAHFVEVHGFAGSSNLC